MEVKNGRTRRSRSEIAPRMEDWPLWCAGQQGPTTLACFCGHNSLRLPKTRLFGSMSERANLNLGGNVSFFNLWVKIIKAWGQFPRRQIPTLQKCEETPPRPGGTASTAPWVLSKPTQVTGLATRGFTLTSHGRRQCFMGDADHAPLLTRHTHTTTGDVPRCHNLEIRV